MYEARSKLTLIKPMLLSILRLWKCGKVIPIPQLFTLKAFDELRSKIYSTQTALLKMISDVITYTEKPTQCHYKT